MQGRLWLGMMLGGLAPLIAAGQAFTQAEAVPLRGTGGGGGHLGGGGGRGWGLMDFQRIGRMT